MSQAWIADEAASISMTGGRRLIPLARGATDMATSAAELALNAETGDSMIVIEAGLLESPFKAAETVRDKQKRSGHSLLSR